MKPEAIQQISTSKPTANSKRANTRNQQRSDGKEEDNDDRNNNNQYNRINDILIVQEFKFLHQI